MRTTSPHGRSSKLLRGRRISTVGTILAAIPVAPIFSLALLSGPISLDIARVHETRAGANCNDEQGLFPTWLGSSSS
jgi:hypothetical protein